MLRDSISFNDIKVIFSGSNGCSARDLKIKYLKKLFEITGTSEEIQKTIVLIDEQIIQTWNYDISKDVIREIFFESEKCANNRANKEKIDAAIEEWEALGLGELKWPFSANGIDGYVHSLNRKYELTGEEKDKLLSDNIIRFRRMKELSQFKNDYIEYLVITYNDNVIPTFGNKRGIDFYIDGVSFDQKVSKSVGGSFIDKYGTNYRSVAINHPELLAKSLYENQDADRFGADPRFLVVYLDTDLNSDEIEELLQQINFTSPINIDFDYPDNEGNIKNYTTFCYLVLLHR